MLSASRLTNRFNPGILSGLAMAGANRKLPNDEHGLPIGDDGVLTAQEISFLPLEKVDLVVLSACETGLGQEAGGEGVIGLQRAFQVSGARTTVASLWNVPDKHTQLLMKRFYDNQWQQEMPRLDALREAQLWMLRGAIGADGKSAVRGLSAPGEQDASSPADAEKSKRLPPYYWAAFVLSGDWR